MTIVIVGGGLAALRTADNLHRRGYTGRLVVVSDEDVLPYNRPPLSKELLSGGMAPDALAFGVGDHLDHVEWLLGRSAVASDLDARTLALDDGQTISFDGLVAATGVKSRRLPFPGPTVGRVVLRDLADAHYLKQALRPGARIVVLGAGFIGCEVARTAKALGCEVDLVAIDPAPMYVPLGAELGAEVQRRHEAEGIRFHLCHTIARTTGSDRVEGVVLDDDTELDADLVLETVGSIPNTSWLEGNGLDLSNGVLTDEYLRAGGRQGIVVAGDIARFANPMFDAPALRIEHWQTAVDTAAFASATLLADLGLLDSSEVKPVSILPWFWSDQGDVHLVSYGMIGLADFVEVIEGSLDAECAVAYSRRGERVGVVLLGMKQQAARFKRDLVRSRQTAR
ncbi:MAG: FAD-dependent oxidoreductase [Mycetocola sp.]